MTRRLRELDRLDRSHGLGVPTGRPAAQKKPRRQSNGTLPGLLVAGIIVAGVVAFSPGDTTGSLRSLIGWGPERLGAPPQVAHGEGTFTFMQTQRNSREPVSYDPCKRIEYVINPEGGPDNYRELVDTAVRHTSEATGFRFEFQGTSDRRDWEIGGIRGRNDPVLVGWATAEEYDRLSGDVAGVGGSLAVRDGTTTTLHYTTGRVVLDVDAFEDLDTMREGALLGQAIVDHEFAHLVGLDHVQDARELMNAENLGVTTYGPGDREGLAALGGVPCT